MTNVSDFYEMLKKSPEDANIIAILPDGEERAVGCTLSDWDEILFLSLPEDESEKATAGKMLWYLEGKSEDESYAGDNGFESCVLGGFDICFVDGSADNEDDPARSVNKVYLDYDQYETLQLVCDCREVEEPILKTLSSITIDLDMKEESGRFDAWVSTEGSSGAHYDNATADELGNIIADLIECLEEAYRK